jgi:hypothetical protein
VSPESIVQRVLQNVPAPVIAPAQEEAMAA